MAEVPDAKFPHILPEPSIVCVPPRLVSMMFRVTPRFIDVGGIVDQYKASAEMIGKAIKSPEVDAIFAHQSEMFKEIHTNLDLLNALEYAALHIILLYARETKISFLGFDGLDGRDPDEMYENYKTIALTPFVATCEQDVRELAELQESVRMFNVQRMLMNMVIHHKAVEMTHT